MQILTVLSAIHRVESATEELYRWLSETLSHDSDASSLFFRMSLQERSHGNLVNYAKRLAARSPDEFGEVSLDLSTVTALIDELIQYRRANPQPDVASAIRFAIQVEENAAERVHRSLVINSNPEIKNIIENLAQADEAHTRSLRSFARKRGLPLS